MTEFNISDFVDYYNSKNKKICSGIIVEQLPLYARIKTNEKIKNVPYKHLKKQETNINMEDEIKEDEIKEDEPKTLRLSKLFNDRIQEWAKNEKKNIVKEQNLNKNHSFAFTNIGDLGEELALYMYPLSIGGSSKGGIAFDNKEINENKETINAREIKVVCLEGSKQCNKCKNKCPRFQNHCLYCNKESSFKLISDSRAGISASAHIKYKNVLSEYIIFIIEYNEQTSIIDFKCFKILSSNIYFNKYIENQYKNSTSNTCNLLPYSYDWHLSGPIKIIDIKINISINEPKIDILFYNMNSIIYEKVPKKIFKQHEIEKYGIIHENTEYEIINEKNITLRSKPFNKSRGKLIRK